MQLIHWAFFLAFLTLHEFVFARYYDPGAARCTDLCPGVYNQLVSGSASARAYGPAVLCNAVFAALLDSALYLGLISSGVRGEKSITLFTALSFLPSLFFLPAFSEAGPFALLEPALLALFFCLQSDASLQNCLDFARLAFPSFPSFPLLRSLHLWARGKRARGSQRVSGSPAGSHAGTPALLPASGPMRRFWPRARVAPRPEPGSVGLLTPDSGGPGAGAPKVAPSPRQRPVRRQQRGSGDSVPGSSNGAGGAWSGRLAAQGAVLGLLLFLDRSYVLLMLFLAARVATAPCAVPSLGRRAGAGQTPGEAARPPGRHAGQYAGQHAGSSSGQPADRLAGHPAGHTAEQSTNASSQRPAQRTAPRAAPRNAQRPAQRGPQGGEPAGSFYAVLLTAVLMVSLLEGPGSLFQAGTYRNAGQVFYFRYLYRLRLLLQTRVSPVLDLYVFLWAGAAALVCGLGLLFSRLRLPADCFAAAVVLLAGRTLSPSGAPLAALALSVAGAALARDDQYLAITCSLAFVSEFLAAELPRAASRDVLYVAAGVFVGYWGAVRFMHHRSMIKDSRSLKYSVHILVLSLVLFGLAIPIAILDFFAGASRKARIAVFVLRIVFEPFRVTTYLLILLALISSRRRARPPAFSAGGGLPDSRVQLSAAALDRELDRELAHGVPAYDGLD